MPGRRYCAMTNLEHRTNRLKRKAAVTSEPPSVLVIALAGMRIGPDLDRYIEANHRPGQRTLVINLLRNAAEGTSQ